MTNSGVDLVVLVVLGSQAILYLPMAWNAIRRRAGRESAAALAGLYALAALLFQAIEVAQRSGLLGNLSAGSASEDAAGQVEQQAIAPLQWYGTLALALLVIFIVRVFLKKTGGEVWLGVGIFWFLLLVLVAENIFHLPDVLWTNGRVQLPRENLSFGLIVTGWGIFTVSALLTLFRAFRQVHQPMHRNRLAYWLPALLLLSTNDGLLLAGYTGWGNPLRVLGAGLMAYTVLTFHPADIRQVMRQAVAFLASLLLAVAFFAGGFSLLDYLLDKNHGYGQTQIMLAVALTGALVLTLLLRSFRGVGKRIFAAEQYDTSRALREYSMSISNILDMERLASVAVGLIMEAMEIQRGFLYLVDTESGESGHKVYNLRPVRSARERPIKPGRLDEASPIVQSILREQRPILQYDIDLLPVFHNLPPAEREWLGSLQVEVYAPIFSKREWIGFLALGAKLSGNRYTDRDLVTVSTLANQTAVALENARLVENLVRLNKELHQAGRALDQAHRNLERLDRTKSDFISIASHELRTPLTIMRGYTEMLMEDNDVQKNPNHLQMIKSLHDSTIRLHEIMDSLFDIAQIDTRTLQLHLQGVDMGELIRGVCSSLGKAITDRNQSLTIDLPALPLVTADPNILRKVFFHLVQNAIKFTPNGGKIGVLGRIVMPKTDLPDGGVEVIFADTGVGVDPNFREIIFTKFYQTEENLNRHSTSKTRFKGGGAGLGLALSRGIVEAHGGKIWVESPGYDEINFPGSQFHITLPLRRLQDGQTVRMGSAVKTTI